MSDHITSETISRRKLLSVLGLGLALAVPTTTLTVSEAEAQTTGMTRRFNQQLLGWSINTQFANAIERFRHDE